MKRNKIIWTLLIACLISGSLVSSLQVIAAEEVTEEVEKMKVRIALTPIKNADGSREVALRATARKEGRVSGVEGVLINLYLNEITKAGMMGSIITDENGNGVFPLVEKFEAASDTISEYNFIARLNNDDRFKDVDKSITIKESSLELSLLEQDSIKYVKVLMTTIDSAGNKVPLADTELHFYVQRMFSLLPFGGDYTYTDEIGEVQVEFPSDLPGDADGFVEIVVKIEEDEVAGTVESREEADWGIPYVVDHEQNERKLWSSGANAPWYLIIGSISIIGLIWGTLIYLVTQLFRVKKLRGA